MTFTEIEFACIGYEKRMSRLMILPRLMAAILYNTNREKGSPVVKPEDIIRLYIDGERKPVELMSKEEFEDALEWRKKIKWQDSRKN